MAAGMLNSLIDILQDVNTADPLTGESSVTYSEVYRRIPAERQDASGGQTRRGSQVEANVRTVFRIPRISGISSHWRVRLDDGTVNRPEFEIIAVVEPEDRSRQFIELHCSGVLS